MKHFLKLKDFSSAELMAMLELAAQMKKNPKGFRDTLDGLAVGLLFQKHSTRTRLSFEVGIGKLGAQPILLDSNTTHLSRGESIPDTMRVFSRYLDMLMIRTYGQDVLERYADNGSIPIINGLTDMYHPCQALSDLLTIQELGSKPFNKMVLTYVGDANNMARSLMWAAALTEMEFRLVSPSGYSLDKQSINEAEAAGLKARFTHEPEAANLANSDIVYTDVWASMGQEKERQKRLQDFRGFTVDSKILAAAPNAKVLHCLPAHKGEEISEEVFEHNADYIFRQAENRMWVQMAIMATLLK